MKINQVEELVGITKKNIRFYEEQGLLRPDRNSENGYREYSLRDVSTLEKIKLLRILDVPIDEILKLQKGEISFALCMERQSVRINRSRQALELSGRYCERLGREVDSYDALKASDYLDEMKRTPLASAAKTLSATDIRRQKKTPIITAAVIASFCLVMIAVLVVCYLKTGMPLGALIWFSVIVLALLIGVLIALFQRIKEINGGEEYEASKY